MHTIQWLVHCTLVFATTTFSQQVQYQFNLPLEEPAGLDDSRLSKNPLFSLHKILVNIESISGNEQAVGKFLEAYLKSHNYTVERQYLDPLPKSLQDSQTDVRKEQKQRFNLLAYPGENRQTPVLLSSVSTRSEQCFPSLYLRICCRSERPMVLFKSSFQMPCKM